MSRHEWGKEIPLVFMVILFSICEFRWFLLWSDQPFALLPSKKLGIKSIYHWDLISALRSDVIKDHLFVCNLNLIRDDLYVVCDLAHLWKSKQIVQNLETIYLKVRYLHPKTVLLKVLYTFQADITFSNVGLGLHINSEVYLRNIKFCL